MLTLDEAVAARFDDLELLPDVEPVPELDLELAERRPFFDVDLAELDFFELAERKPFLEVVFEDFLLAAIAFSFKITADTTIAESKTFPRFIRDLPPPNSSILSNHISPFLSYLR